MKLSKIFEEIEEIISGTYEALDSQALQDIRKIISELEKEEKGDKNGKDNNRRS